jgi:hypothetical protein
MPGRYYYAPVDPGYAQMGQAIMRGLNQGLANYRAMHEQARRRKQEEDLFALEEALAGARAQEVGVEPLEGVLDRHFPAAPTPSLAGVNDAPDLFDVEPVSLSGGPSITRRPSSRSTRRMPEPLIPEAAAPSAAKGDPRLPVQPGMGTPAVVSTDRGGMHDGPRLGTDWIRRDLTQRAAELNREPTVLDYEAVNDRYAINRRNLPSAKSTRAAESERIAEEMELLDREDLIAEAIRQSRPDLPPERVQSLARMEAQGVGIDDLIPPPPYDPDADTEIQRERTMKKEGLGAYDPNRRRQTSEETRGERSDRRRIALTRIENMLAAGAPTGQVSQAMRTYRDLEGVWTPDDVVATSRKLSSAKRPPSDEDTFREGYYEELGKPKTPFQRDLVEQLVQGRTAEQVLAELKERVGEEHKLYRDAEAYLFSLTR